MGFRAFPEEIKIDQILFSDPINTALGFIIVLAAISLIMLAVEGMLIDAVPPAIASGIWALFIMRDTFIIHE